MSFGLLMPAWVAAQECIDYGLYPHYIGRIDTPSWASNVAMVGNLAYVADANGGLRVIDITNPAEPAPLGALEFYALDVAVAGSYAYIVGGMYSDLRVVDVSDPAAPRELSRVPTPGDPLGVAVSGNHLYVADGSAGLQVLDITNPASPRFVGSATTPGHASHIAVAGDYTYVSDVIYGMTQWASHVRVIDITDPVSPRIVSSVETPREITDLAVSGNNVYVTTLGILYPLGGHGPALLVLDVSDPAAPQIAASLDLGIALAVALSGTFALVSVHAGISVIDVAEATAPQPVDFIPTAPGLASALAVSGTVACVAAGEAGLGLVDIAHPNPPPAVAFVDSVPSGPCGPTSLFPAQDVAVLGNLAYIAAGTSLQVFDVSTPAAPTFVGAVGTPQYANSVFVHGNYAFVTNEYPFLPGKPSFCPGKAAEPYAAMGAMVQSVRSEELATGSEALATHGEERATRSEELATSGEDPLLQSDVAHTLHIIDVSNPAWPQIVASMDTPGRPEGVVVSGDHAFVAVGSAGLLVLDISVPAAPQVVTTLDTPNYANAVAIAGDHLYVADGHSGLQAIDIANPNAPRIVGAIDTPDFADDVAVAGNRAYVTSGFAGLQVVDITDPADPRLLTSIDPPGYVGDIALAGRHAYVADAYAGLLVIDVGTDETPRVVGAADLRDQPQAVAVANGLAWVVSWRGLHILPLQCPTAGSVAVLLSGFTLARAGSAVEIHWKVAGRAGGEEFRLTATQQEASWNVPIGAQAGSEFTAVDRAAQLAAGGEVEYTLSFRDPGRSWAVLARQRIVLDGEPVVTRLFAPYPNPARPRLVVPYVLGREQRVRLSVHDVLGREVVCLFSGSSRAGAGQFVWSGEDERGKPVASGVYFVKLATSAGKETRKVVVAR